MNTSFIAALVMLINAARIEAQLPQLTEDPALSQRAQQRAQWMCDTRQFTHDGMMAAFEGSPYRWKGENLAQGHRDPRAVHGQLMNSPGHRANILKKQFDSVGIGHACDITVELFGGR
jgi:uncharacterized protein YkwD